MSESVYLVTEPAIPGQDGRDPEAQWVPPSWDDNQPLAAGASKLPNDAGLIYKVLGRETEPVRTKVREFCAVARAETVGRATPPARLVGWTLRRVRQLVGCPQ